MGVNAPILFFLLLHKIALKRIADYIFYDRLYTRRSHMTALIKGIIIGAGTAIGVGGAAVGTAAIVKKKKTSSNNSDAAPKVVNKTRPVDS